MATEITVTLTSKVGAAVGVLARAAGKPPEEYLAGAVEGHVTDALRRAKEQAHTILANDLETVLR